MTDATTRWMNAYLAAWESNDPDDIRALFTVDAIYRVVPWIDGWQGADAIVDGWLDRKDDPGNHTFEWNPLVTTDDLWAVQGTTAYTDGRVYSNLWIIRPAADGRAREFTEWWMDQPAGS